MNTGSITFVVTCRSGLGHLRRVTTIAHAIKKANSQHPLYLLANAKADGLDPEELAVFDDIIVAERSKMSVMLQSICPTTIVLDTINVPDIDACQSPKILILRETPDERLNRFVLSRSQRWDRVLIPNPREYWMPESSERFSPDVRPVGWIYRHTGVRNNHERTPGVLIATGGGGTDDTRTSLYRLIEQVISLAQGKSKVKFVVRQAIGPRASTSERIKHVDEIVDPGGALNAYFRAADIVISTAGYNSVLELASTDTPSMLVAISRAIDDQASRANLWGSRLGFCLTDNNQKLAAEWLVQHLESQQRREPCSLGASGEHLTARMILELTR